MRLLKSNRLRFFLPASIAAMLIGTAMEHQHAQERLVYQDVTQSVDTRVEDLLSQMTLEEKIALVHADSKFTTAAMPRLGLPRRWLSDGPHGVARRCWSGHLAARWTHR